MLEIVPQTGTTVRVLFVLLMSCVAFLGSCVEAGSPDGPSLGYREVLELGGEGGPGEIPYQPMDLDRLGDGSYLLSVAYRGPGSVPMLFGPDGDFRSKVGRDGEGPGEFGAAMMSDVLPGDSILVFDQLRSRFSVVAPDGTARTIRHAGSVADVRVLAWPDSVLAVHWPQGAEGFPYRMLSLRDSEASVLTEFGEPFPTANPGFLSFRRYTSEPVGGAVWTTSGSEYVLERVDLNGQTTHRLELQSPNFVLEGTGSGPDSIPPPAVVAIEALSQDTLAVGLIVARSDWDEAEWEVVGHGAANAYRPPPVTDRWSSVLELRHAESGELIGSQSFPGVIFRILPDGALALHDLEGPGFPVIRVFQR